MGAAPEPLLQTTRQRLFTLRTDDAAFARELLNSPGWLRHIGDRGVHSLSDAEAYLRDGPIAMQARFGFSLYRVERRADGASMGVCGLIRRDGTPGPDLGFAFLPRFTGLGHAHEAASAVLRHARALGLERVWALATSDNVASLGLLHKLGFGDQRPWPLGGETLCLLNRAT
jgi:[ribosomal protein S5]-alanine N-acetyltransferase